MPSNTWQILSGLRKTPWREPRHWETRGTFRPAMVFGTGGLDAYHLVALPVAQAHIPQSVDVDLLQFFLLLFDNNLHLLWHCHGSRCVDFDSDRGRISIGSENRLAPFLISLTHPARRGRARPVRIFGDIFRGKEQGASRILPMFELCPIDPKGIAVILV